MVNEKKSNRWFILGALGCILVGTGFSLAVEASHWKHQGEPIWIWVGAGTLGLAILISGIITLINNRQ